MLLPSFFIIDFDKYDSLPEIQLPENAFISYKIGDGSAPLIKSFYKKIFSLPQKYPFCLLIDLNSQRSKAESEINEFVDLLVSFSFSLNYIKTSYDAPRVLFELSNAEDKKYVSVICDAFKNQGYDYIEPALIYSDRALQDNERTNFRFDLQKSVTHLLHDYISSIKRVDSSGSYFFFFLEDPAKLYEILDIIQKAETTIREDTPQTYYLLKENMSASAKERRSIVKIGLLQEELDSLKAYNLFPTREKDRTKELQQWYDKEYEILPLWYKRVGHVLKVLMGKRTFRSLFDDNVKKYKD